MDFYYWPPASKWGLPTFDIKSLHVLTYIKLSGAEVNLHPTSKSWLPWLPKERKTLPCLVTPNGVIIDKPEDIIQYLREAGFDLDATFNNDVVSNVLPISALVSEKLLPAVLFTMWIDNVNLKDVTHGLYARSCRFPLNFIHPNYMQRTHENFVKEFKFVRDDDVNDEKVVKQLESDAQSTLNLLSEYLGEKEYILGKDPSSLDALVISILAPILKIPFTSGKVKNHLIGCLNVCQYINRILKDCFREETNQSTTTTDTSDTKSAASDTNDPDSVDWKYDVFFPISVATIAMLSYAAHAGLLNRSMK